MPWLPAASWRRGRLASLKAESVQLSGASASGPAAPSRRKRLCNLERRTCCSFPLGRGPRDLGRDGAPGAAHQAASRHSQLGASVLGWRGRPLFLTAAVLSGAASTTRSGAPASARRCSAAFGRLAALRASHLRSRRPPAASCGSEGQLTFCVAASGPRIQDHGTGAPPARPPTPARGLHSLAPQPNGAPHELLTLL